MLKPLFPNVRFVVATADNGYFSQRYGPSFGSIFKACSECDFCAIVNADLIMLKADVAKVMLAQKDTFLVARRIDITEIGGDIIGVYSRGIDAVLFRPSRFAPLVEDPGLGRFQVGAPFWDIVIPIAASFHGAVSFIRPPFLLHAIHPANWSDDDYTELRRNAIEAILNHAKVSSPHSARARLFLGLIEKHVGPVGGALDEHSTRNAMTIFDSWLRKLETHSSTSIHAEIESATSTGPFVRFPDRLPEHPVDTSDRTSWMARVKSVLRDGSTRRAIRSEISRLLFP